MSNLSIECLSKTPISEAAIQVVYDSRDNPAHAREVVSLWLKNVCLSHERLRAELYGAEIVLGDTKREVASVLMMLDELADVWGDEGKFRACRDRLRKLTGTD